MFASGDCTVRFWRYLYYTCSAKEESDSLLIEQRRKTAGYHVVSLQTVNKMNRASKRPSSLLEGSIFLKNTQEGPPRIYVR